MNFKLLFLSLLIGSSLDLVAQKVAPTSQKTVSDYSKAFEIIGKLGIKVDMPLDTMLKSIKDMKKSADVMGFRTEYTVKLNEHGLKGLTFYFDKDNHQPLYEIIMDFDNADTLEALCKMDLGPGNHPRLEEHWIMNLNRESLAFILWRFENKLIMAANLPDTEFAEDYTFQFDQVFIEAFLKQNAEEGSPPENTVPENEIPADQVLTQTLNQYLTSAINDFEDLKGDPVEGKKDNYFALLPFGENTVIRKTAGNAWRLETRLVLNQELDAARSNYQSFIEQIQGLEALEYKLIKKSEYTTNTGNTYLWEVQNMDGDAIGVILKLQLFAAGKGLYSILMEVGK